MAKKSAAVAIILTLCCLLILGAAPSTARANSAQSTFSGVDATGAMMADAESPVIVEKERLTLDLNELPYNYYETEQAFLAYGGKATAEYTFYNPSQYTVTSKLLFPFGKAPDYYVYDSDGLPDDSLKYGITLNGEPLNAKIRHTYSDERQFSVNTDLALVCDGYTEDEIFSPETTLTEYKYFVGGLYGKNYTAPFAAFSVQKDENTAYILNSDGGGARIEGNTLITGTWVNDGETLLVYAVGEPKAPQWKIYNDGGMRKAIDAQISLQTTRTLTFKDFATADWNENGTVSQTDWYNAYVAYLNANKQEGYRFFRNPGGDLYESLTRWYEYEITFAPGQKIVNSVTVPMYPLINLDWEPTVYKYTYLLSPAKTWKEFGELEIEINTPYYMKSSKIEGFEKTDNGFSVNLDGLPDGELVFELCTEEKPARSENYKRSMLTTVLITVGFIVVPVVLPVAAIVIAIIVQRKKKKNILP